MTGEKRSVIKMGHSSITYENGALVVAPRSYQITLPKWWCRKHSFPEHVYVEEMDDGALRVVAG